VTADERRRLKAAVDQRMRELNGIGSHRRGRCEAFARSSGLRCFYQALDGHRFCRHHLYREAAAA
jgi:hypothetical protein